MKGILVRVGIDQAYGQCNAPADPVTGQFLYMPIPEKKGIRFHQGCRRSYSEMVPALDGFAQHHGFVSAAELGWPTELASRAMHLDPDFDHLTYGDVGDQRGSGIRELERGDLLVFYAGLRPIRPCDHKLIYAIIGMFVVDEVVRASSVPASRRHQNAHTRKRRFGPSDIVVWARPEVSGRLTRYLEIGEYRDGAYRVRRDLLKAWGGLSVSDGYIQRSARPPRFKDAMRFYDWFQSQAVPLVPVNNPPIPEPGVVLVHLRRPRMHDPYETRADPFWEFGSFGCTGCHGRNLLHPAYADELAGARLGFAQGGPSGMRLVMLTPPVQIVHHELGCEVCWEPAEMPFRYDRAPLLIDNRGRSDFKQLRRHFQKTNRDSWVAAFSSRFRSRRRPLGEAVSREIQGVYDEQRRTVAPEDLASFYWDSLPQIPNSPDHVRRQTYNRLVAGLNGRQRRSSSCQTGKRAAQFKPKRQC